MDRRLVAGFAEEFAEGKKHLSDVSSWLKRFYDHLHARRENLKFGIFGFCVVSVRGKFCRKAQQWQKPKCKNAKFSNYLYERASGRKTFLATN